jgi:DNA-binding transcriptional ArsR family regulator
MHAFDILGDPVRRRIVELLSQGERSAGDIGAVVEREFRISQPAVSQQLRILRDSGFATVRPQGTRRLYVMNPTPLHEIADWVDRNRRHWEDSFDSLDSHLAKVQGRARHPVTTKRASKTIRKRTSND